MASAVTLGSNGSANIDFGAVSGADCRGQGHRESRGGERGGTAGEGVDQGGKARRVLQVQCLPGQLCECVWLCAFQRAPKHANNAKRITCIFTITLSYKEKSLCQCHTQRCSHMKPCPSPTEKPL